MVYPIRKPSSQTVQNAISDYLNFNRHKFDQYGNFDPTPDVRDFLPRLLTVSDPYKPPKLPPEKPWLNRAQQNRAKYPVANQLRNPKTDEDLVRDRYEERIEHAKRRRKYNKDQCDKHHEAALKRCNDMYWSNALYPDGAYEGCKKRASELWQECYDKKKYPKDKMEWANRDMDILDESEISKPPTISFERELEPVTELSKSKSRSPYDPYSLSTHSAEDATGAAGPNWEHYSPAQASWASTMGLSKPPRVEGWQPSLPPELQRLLPLIPSLARALQGVRATPGMGFVGGSMGGGGGGKPRLVPRYPGDPLFSPVKLY